jgi:hypothetical protein
MAENKTKATAADVQAFLAAIENPHRRADGQALATIMTRISGDPPVMWGPSIVGFGLRRYKYESGREGEICSIGFSPRKAALVLYLNCDLDSSQALLDRLGKHERGRGCLYVKKLGDVDAEILEEMIATAWAARA